jgi:hypothetical protein
MKPDADKIEIILAELQSGHKVQIDGSSRAHAYCGYKDGSWIYGIFNEGHRKETSWTREKMITLITGSFSKFQPLLKLTHERFVAQALHSGDSKLALQHLDAWCEMGDSLQEGPVLRAYLEWPEVLPSEEVKDLIRSKINAFTAFHVLMTPLHFKNTVENGLLGLKYVEVLVEIVGEIQGCERLRDIFRRMSRL